MPIYTSVHYLMKAHHFSYLYIKAERSHTLGEYLGILEPLNAIALLVLDSAYRIKRLEDLHVSHVNIRKITVVATLHGLRSNEM